MPRITVHEPYGRDEIVRELRAVHNQSREFWDSFSTAEFFSPFGDAWSPADNVRHLLKSNRPVARALATPKALLALRFGVGRRASVPYSELRARYLSLLATGVTAGRFTPAPLNPSEQSEEHRRSLMATMDAVFENLTTTASRWQEWQLDRLRLPHPALGKLTVREMLFFTVYHNIHHVENVVRRMSALE
jgi:hypothetical protein